MKKLLLAATLMGVISPLYAQDLYPFEEFFTISYDGKLIENNATIEIDSFEEADPFIYGDGFSTYDGVIRVNNNGVMPQYIHAVYKPYQKPTGAEYFADPFYWGNVQLCYARYINDQKETGNCLAGDISTPDNLYFADDSVEVPSMIRGYLDWELHVVACDKNSNATYLLTLEAVEVDNPNNTKNYFVVSEPLNIYINFSKAAQSGIDRINASEADGEYFDLQGRRVNNPDKGIYLFRQGNKTIKKIVK